LTVPTNQGANVVIDKQKWDAMPTQRKLDWLREFVTHVADLANHNIHARKSQMDDLRRRLRALEKEGEEQAEVQSEEMVRPLK
jgi:hypothetical protein